MLLPATMTTEMTMMVGEPPQNSAEESMPLKWVRTVDGRMLASWHKMTRKAGN